MQLYLCTGQFNRNDLLIVFTFNFSKNLVLFCIKAISRAKDFFIYQNFLLYHIYPAWVIDKVIKLDFRFRSVTKL